MSRLAGLTLLLMILFTLLIGVMRFFGQPSTVPEIFQSSPDCEMYCWSGIHLDKTTLDEAERILRDRDTAWIDKPYGDTLYWEGRSPSIKGQIADMDGGGKVKAIYLTLSDEISFTIGDAIQQWGPPIAIKIQLCNSERPPIMIYFKGEITAFIYLSRETALSQIANPSILPTTPITAVEYDDPPNFSMDETRSWNGFALIRQNDVLPGYCG